MHNINKSKVLEFNEKVNLLNIRNEIAPSVNSQILNGVMKKTVFDKLENKKIRANEMLAINIKKNMDI